MRLQWYRIGRAAIAARWARLEALAGWLSANIHRSLTVSPLPLPFLSKVMLPRRVIFFSIKLSKEPLSGVNAPPLVKLPRLDLDFSAIRKRVPWSRHTPPLPQGNMTPIDANTTQAAITVASVRIARAAAES